MSNTPATTECSAYTAGYHRRWYVYAVIPLLFVVSLAFGVLSGISPISLGTFFDGVMSLVLLPLLVATPVAVIWAFFGYYWDAKVLREADSDWVPLWWVWLLAHIITTPLLTVPVYLLRRTQKTGIPPYVSNLYYKAREMTV
jgi:hypothetical protein